MTDKLRKHIIKDKFTIYQALVKLNDIGENMTLFITDEKDKMIGTVTDGDIRRALINKVSLDEPVHKAMFTNFQFVLADNIQVEKIKKIRKQGITLIPVLSDKKVICNIIDLNKNRNYLPSTVMIMAGGRGERLRPLTDKTPKPLLKIGEKAIIEHNIDRLKEFGLENYVISVRYMGQQIKDYLNKRYTNEIDLSYVEEDVPLGTIGSLKLVKSFEHEDILVMNSDLYTNIDFEDFYIEFKKSDADMAVATIPYSIKIPYAILKINNERITEFEEKPTFNYKTNAGIYFLKKECIKYIPENEFYNATDLLEELIRKRKKVIHFPILGYWIDIGKPEDYQKAVEYYNHSL